MPNINLKKKSIAFIETILPLDTYLQITNYKLLGYKFKVKYKIYKEKDWKSM